ncbi:BCCT family transporter [Roseovarius sp. THAF9]|uniref:BCCT family transporter n=1 Tax=Roseovarius sp. THAF9 TaxID=2587847 RepID=UPI001C129E63|nr:BCCT family transporter [Roseovarius sp. THAF9]
MTQQAGQARRRPLPGTTLLAALRRFIFLVTSADAGTVVLSMMTTDGNLPPVIQKMIWGI